MKIKFCGAVNSVTGSCHLIMTKKHKVLLDCGQFQGGKSMEAKNYEPFPFEPAEIDCLLLSHAHVDHCGRIPLLVRQGFKGKIYCTDATADLVQVMLKDCGYIHEKEAIRANRKAKRAGKPEVEPLYTLKEAEDSLKYLAPVLYDQLIVINDEMRIVFNDAGHILGSAITELWVEEGENISKIVYSGDIGMMHRPILRDPTIIKKADYVIMETTYGNRIHEKNESSINKLIDIIVTTAKRGGNVIIPAFAVGRTQELIYELNRFYEDDTEYRDILDKLFVYVDSPMAITTTEVFRKNVQVFDEETQNYIISGDNPLDFRNLRFTRTSEESKALNIDAQPKIIISASGMCEAGRIRHHLKHNLWDAKNSIVFVGYQANGSLGRIILDGQKDVSIFGEQVQINAEIYNLEGFSGHADREGLLEWLDGFKVKPHDIFLVHGEDEAKYDFAVTVKDVLKYDCTVVDGISEYELSKDTVLTRGDVIEDIVDEEQISQVRGKIKKIKDNLGDILYHTHLAISDNISPGQMIKINNLILELEKDALNLSAAVTKDELKDSTLG